MTANYQLNVDQKTLGCLLSWPVIIIIFFVFSPIGFVLLILRLRQDLATSMSFGRTLMGFGGIVAFISGIGILSGLAADSGFPVLFALPFFIGGVAVAWKGLQLTFEGSTTRRYIDLIVNQRQRSVNNIARILAPTTPETVAKEVQRLIDRGFLRGFSLDPQSGIITKLDRPPSLPPAHAPRDAAPARPSAFTCKACGANNEVTTPSGPVRCEYCETIAKLKPQ